MPLPNMAGLSLNGAPTSEMMEDRLTPAQVAQLNGNGGREPLTLLDYDDRTLYFRVERRDPDRFPTEFERYDYYDVDALSSWVKSGHNNNPKDPAAELKPSDLELLDPNYDPFARLRPTGVDIDFVRDRLPMPSIKAMELPWFGKAYNTTLTDPYDADEQLKRLLVQVSDAARLVRIYEKKQREALLGKQRAFELLEDAADLSQSAMVAEPTKAAEFAKQEYRIDRFNNAYIALSRWIVFDGLKFQEALFALNNSPRMSDEEDKVVVSTRSTRSRFYGSTGQEWRSRMDRAKDFADEHNIDIETRREDYNDPYDPTHLL